VIHWLLILATALGPGEVEQAGVRVKTDVKSNRYQWTVTNVSAEPINSVRIPVRHMYAPVVPQGWEADLPKKGTYFHAWTEDDRRAIAPGQTRQFEATVTVAEASLGPVTVAVATVGGGVVQVGEVWSATPMSGTQAYLVALMLAVIALAQWLIARKSAPAAE
jgi:hypothetical protein